MDIEQEYVKYQYLAQYTASKIYKASTLPEYIKLEFYNEAQAELIDVLNKHSKLFREKILTKEHRQILKNRICWDIINRINKYHCSFVGVKMLKTQQKYHLYPVNQNDYNYEHKNAIDIPDNTSPIAPIMLKEDKKNIQRIFNRICKILRINAKNKLILYQKYDHYKRRHKNTSIQEYNKVKKELTNKITNYVLTHNEYYNEQLGFK